MSVQFYPGQVVVRVAPPISRTAKRHMVIGGKYVIEKAWRPWEPCPTGGYINRLGALSLVGIPTEQLQEWRSPFGWDPNDFRPLDDGDIAKMKKRQDKPVDVKPKENA